MRYRAGLDLVLKGVTIDVKVGGWVGGWVSQFQIT